MEPAAAAAPVPTPPLSQDNTILSHLETTCRRLREENATRPPESGPASVHLMLLRGQQLPQKSPISPPPRRDSDYKADLDIASYDEGFNDDYEEGYAAGFLAAEAVF
ncbi:hypothetical protein B0T17DRAFT_509155 [Bombardia bombarda]|uniref:Uncharacterized protein n=1 Tax=Bombardia bombarda TaxID=252184 RepID=A0AA40C1Y5_9PEZI|nr:hypothetical protein B0T17DRAFT_509155 [Bombardia bombarda]